MEKPLNQQILDRIYELTEKKVSLDQLSRQAVEEIAAEVKVTIP
ncbi:MAG: hypothetical protein ACLFR2_06200 [Candidatus Kapaibacterium sp.]